MILENIQCWVVGEGLAGTENQCLGVAEQLGLNPSIKRIKLREPWKTFSPKLEFEQWWSFDPLIFPPWPDLVIASGRKSIAVSRYIKSRSNNKTFTVQIQDPRITANNFDLVVVPTHDPLRGENVIVTKAAPNRITQRKLSLAASSFKHLEKLNSPKAAVLIGGNSKTHKMTKEIIEKLIKQLQELSASNISLMVTVSRRTPKEFSKLLKDKLRSNNIYFWDGIGENPYFAFLHYADHIIVTNDSASMLSEAATTGKPVYSIALKGGSEKFTALYKTLSHHGALKNFNGTLENYTYEPLNDAAFVATAIKKAFAKHRENLAEIARKNKTG